MQVRARIQQSNLLVVVLLTSGLSSELNVTDVTERMPTTVNCEKLQMDEDDDPCCGPDEVAAYVEKFKTGRMSLSTNDQLSYTRQMDEGGLGPTSARCANCHCIMDSFDAEHKQKLHGKIQALVAHQGVKKTLANGFEDTEHGRKAEEIHNLHLGMMTRKDWEDFDKHAKESMNEDEYERLKVLLTKSRRRQANDVAKYGIANNNSMLAALADDRDPTKNQILKVRDQYYKAAEKVWRQVGPIDRVTKQPMEEEYDGSERPREATWEKMKKNFIAETATDWMNKVQEFKVMSTKFRQSAEAIYNEIVRAHNVLTATQVQTLPTELKAMNQPKSQYHAQAEFQHLRERLMSSKAEGTINDAHKELQQMARDIAEHVYQHEKPSLLSEFGKNDYIWGSNVDTVFAGTDVTVAPAGSPVLSLQVEQLMKAGKTEAEIHEAIQAGHHVQPMEKRDEAHDNGIEALKHSHESNHLILTGRR